MTADYLSEAIGSIDDKFITRSGRPKARALALRWMAAAAAFILLAGVVFAAIKLAPEKAAVPKEAVLPPVRWGERRPSTPWGHVNYFTFDSFYDENEAVCILTIGDWLGDNGTGTYYEATVEKVYKGDMPEKIMLYQMGNREWTCENFPLFTYGDRLLIALEKWPEEPDFDDGFELKDCYQCAGPDNAQFFISQDDKGVEYLLDLSGLFSYTNEIGSDLRFTNYGNDLVLVRELCKNLAEIDPVAADLMLNRDKYYNYDSTWRPRFIYSFEEFDAYLSSK